MAERIIDYLSREWKVLDSPHPHISLSRDKSRHRIGLMPIHPMGAHPNSQQLGAIYLDTGVRLAAHTAFDIERRRFWVADQFMSTMKGL